MRKQWLLACVGLVMAVLAVAAIGCSDDEKSDGGGDATATEVMSDTPEATDVMSETPEAGAEIAPITLDAMGESGVTGSATITMNDAGGADVEVTIAAGLAEGSHANHLHHGTCEAQGEVHVALTNLEAGADGSAPATTTTIGGADQPAYDHWLSREHYIAVHDLDEALTVVACGNVVAAE